MRDGVSRKILTGTLIANLAIVLHHGNIAGLYPEAATPLDTGVMNFFSDLALPAMSFFFLLTGYLFFRNFRMDKLAGKWKSRVFSLLIPYIIWNVIAAIESLFNPEGTEAFSHGIFFFLKDTFWVAAGEAETGGLCANTPLWYIFRIMGFALLAPVIFYAMKKWIGIAVIAGLTAVNLVCGVRYYDFSYFLPVYLAGAYLGLNYAEEAEGWLDRKGGPAGLLLAIAGVLAYCLAIKYVIGTPAGEMAIRYLAAVPCVFLVKYLRPMAKTEKVKGLGMFVYCSHVLVMKVMRVVTVKFTGNLLAAFAVHTAVSLGIIYLAYRILQRFAPKVLSVLVGGRG